MILPFKDRFEPLILGGQKIHSIREDKHFRWKAGRTIHMVVGARTKRQRQFDLRKCHGVQSIIIGKQHGKYYVFVDDILLCRNEEIELARNDGFENIDQLLDWFVPGERGIFTGKIIHWTDKKYGELSSLGIGSAFPLTK